MSKIHFTTNDSKGFHKGNTKAILTKAQRSIIFASLRLCAKLKIREICEQKSPANRIISALIQK